MSRADIVRALQDVADAINASAEAIALGADIGEELASCMSSIDDVGSSTDSDNKDEVDALDWLEQHFTSF